MPLLLALLLLPLIEIALFIIIGGWLGLWPTLVLVVLGALTGVLILRGQRERAEIMMRGGLRNVSPGTFLAQGAFRLVAALLLILPGFLTDALGLVLLVPPVQRVLVGAIALRVRVETAPGAQQGAGRRGGPGNIIDGEYTVDREEPAAPSGRQHIDGPHRH
ncbi:MAG: FxsA family protein [Pararhodobacter sp.]